MRKLIVEEGIYIEASFDGAYEIFIKLLNYDLLKILIIIYLAYFSISELEALSTEAGR